MKKLLMILAAFGLAGHALANEAAPEKADGKSVQEYKAKQEAQKKKDAQKKAKKKADEEHKKAEGEASH
ncbi:hypothetical protein [Chitinolyticbacter meiyuanensis]|uniref:hypothetical protein n=1 Tax=Chitinolyticbacter meiyuanensis TaxID=682798 RepID=UPI0011E606DE|nr:hypothetical protein [Chitinolyticbacter meiyuanensis]